MSIQDSRCFSSLEAKESKLPVADDVSAIVHEVGEQENLLIAFQTTNQVWNRAGKGYILQFTYSVCGCVLFI